MCTHQLSREQLDANQEGDREDARALAPSLEAFLTKHDGERMRNSSFGGFRSVPDLTAEAGNSFNARASRSMQLSTLWPWHLLCCCSNRCQTGNTPRIAPNCMHSFRLHAAMQRRLFESRGPLGRGQMTEHARDERPRSRMVGWAEKTCQDFARLRARESGVTSESRSSKASRHMGRPKSQTTSCLALGQRSFHGGRATVRTVWK